MRSHKWLLMNLVVAGAVLFVAALVLVASGKAYWWQAPAAPAGPASPIHAAFVRFRELAAHPPPQRDDAWQRELNWGFAAVDELFVEREDRQGVTIDERIAFMDCCNLLKPYFRELREDPAQSEVRRKRLVAAADKALKVFP